MTLRSSDLQSDGDLDSIRNSCDVLNNVLRRNCQEITPGDSHKSTYRQGVDQVVNKFLFDMRGKGPLSVLTLFFQRKDICQIKANICHGLHVTTISGLYYFGSLMETKMD